MKMDLNPFSVSRKAQKEDNKNRNRSIQI